MNIKDCLKKGFLKNIAAYCNKTLRICRNMISPIANFIKNAYLYFFMSQTKDLHSSLKREIEAPQDEKYKEIKNMLNQVIKR